MRPFELSPDELKEKLEEMVEATISDLGSEFLLMPSGPAFILYDDFRTAYEVLKKGTHAFLDFTTARIFDAVIQDSRAFCVLRSMLGMTPPEWAELAKSQYDVIIPQNAARILDRRCREDIRYVQRLETKYQTQLEKHREKGLSPPQRPVSLVRIDTLIQTAVHFLAKGAPKAVDGVVHRMAKFDSSHGIESLQYAAKENVPYAVLLYERYLGRPFAAHRDAVSELVGETIENAIEDYLRKSGVTYRKTQRAERIPGFGQAPDFCIPDEIHPAVVIEAKLTSDDGTARDKVARIKELETQRNQHVAEGRPFYEVVACIDGRGFRERREDMRQMLLRLNGKVFTMATLDQLITHTRIREFVSSPT
jgi:hypothetical protein